MLRALLLLVAAAVLVCDAFVPVPASQYRSHSALKASASNSDAKSTIVVVSPPGGVGEVTAVKAASLGARVKWFIVSSKYAKLSQSITFSQDALRDIQMAGGAVELAGADADALLQERDAVAAVSTWCGTAIDGIVCCMDGVEQVVADTENTNVDFAAVWQDAVKVAAREASKGVTGLKLAIVAESAADDDDDVFDSGDNDDDTAPIGGLLGGLFGAKDTVAIPKSLTSAIKANSILRHGTLFGIPESSVRSHQKTNVTRYQYRSIPYTCPDSQPNSALSFISP